MNDIDLPIHVCYDANIINSDQSGTKPPPRLVFQDIRSIAILTRPELYQLSVVRFNLPTANSLLVFTPNIQINNYYPNQSKSNNILIYIDIL